MTSNAHLDEYIDFQKYWLVLKRRWIPGTATFLLVTTLALVHSSRLPKIYEAKAELLIKTDRTSQLTGLENGTEEAKKIGVDSDPLATEARIFLSRPILEKLIQELNLQNDSGELLKHGAIAGDMEVDIVTGTDILEISYASEESELAAAVVNKAVELYTESDTLRNRAQAKSAKEFIAKQLPQIEANVAQAEANLRRFKNQNRIINLEHETSTTVNSISDLKSQIDEVEAELSNVNARYNKLKNQLGISWQEASALSSLSQSPAVQRSLDQLQEIKVELAQKRDYLSNNAPQLISLKEKEANLTDLLDQQIANTLNGQQQDSIQNVNILGLGELKQEQITDFTNLGLNKDGLEKQLETLNSTYNSHKQRSDILPELHEQQRELERRVEGAQSTYQTLLSKLQETEIVEQQNIGNIQVVASALVPEGPSSEYRMTKKLIVAGGAVFGAFLGVIVAFFLDICDKTIKNTQEIKAIFPYSFVGTIPILDRIIPNRQLLLPDNSTANLPQLALSKFSVLPVNEAYHDLQLNLKLLDKEVANKVIAVTSSVSAEGKSSVSANLAIAQAQCNQKVLLVDGDLRRPTQHNLWEVSNNRGLTNILQKEIEWHDAIHEITPNLDVITSGTIPKHPISLLNSPLMKTFIATICEHYNYIIFDTPPLVGLADSKIICKLADGLVLIVRPGVANYDSVAAATELLGDKDLNVLGVVANGADLDRELHSHGYYYADQKYLAATN